MQTSALPSKANLDRTVSRDSEPDEDLADNKGGICIKVIVNITPDMLEDTEDGEPLEFKVVPHTMKVISGRSRLHKSRDDLPAKPAKRNKDESGEDFSDKESHEEEISDLGKEEKHEEERSDLGKEEKHEKEQEKEGKHVEQGNQEDFFEFDETDDLEDE